MIFFPQEEVRRNKGKKADDPFTRRSTKPRMVFKVHDQENMEDAQMILAAEVSREYFTWQYIPEDKSELHTRRRENLKSQSKFS
jgi:RNA polymerase-associated protein RTF1